MKLKLTLLILLTAAALSACQLADQASDSIGEPEKLTFLAHDSYDVNAELIKEFEEANHAKIEFLKAGDTGTVLNTAILNRDNPTADILYGVDNTFLSRALEEDLFESYEPAGISQVKAELLQTGTEGKLTPVDYGDVCLNYDKAWFEKHDLALPQSLDDLTRDEYRDLLVVQNPASSSPGLAFLLATVAYFGEDGYQDYWARLQANGLKVSEDWESSYWGEFSAASDGIRPIVVSYATSPAAEVYFSEGAYSEPRTGIIPAEGSCFRQIEYVGILKGTAHRELAEKFIDFMLSPEYQEDIPLHMWVYPATSSAQLPKLFIDFALDIEQPARITAADIHAQREEWIEGWLETVMR